MQSFTQCLPSLSCVKLLIAKASWKASLRKISARNGRLQIAWVYSRFSLIKLLRTMFYFVFKGMNYCYFSCLLTWYGQTINKKRRRKKKKRKEEGTFNLLPSVQSLISLRNISRGFFVAPTKKFIAEFFYFALVLGEKIF